MWLFWIVAGLMAAAAAAAVLARAGAAVRTAGAGAEDPTLSVYRRQLAELDDLSTRGLLGEEERKSAYAEAGRRLLSAADRGGSREVAGGRGPRLILLIGIAAAVLGALALYLLVGSPGDPDQPYLSRLAAWRARPQDLGPAEMAAVLRDVVKARPGDPRPRAYLGRAELAAGDADAAVDDLRKAATLAPKDADMQVMLGEALFEAADGAASPDAQAAFQRALMLDPKNIAARYMLARTAIAAGRRDEGVAAWRALQAELPAGDPRRTMLDTDIAKALAPAGDPIDAAAASAAAAGVGQGGDQAAFIRAMVGQLAQRLQTTPDDPDGWARLVRAYRVLNDKDAETKALDRARKLFAGRPTDLAKVEAEAH